MMDDAGVVLADLRNIMAPPDHTTFAQESLREFTSNR